MQIPGAVHILAGGKVGIGHPIAAVGLELNDIAADIPHRGKRLSIKDLAGVCRKVVFQFASHINAPLVLDEQISLGLQPMDLLSLFGAANVLDRSRLNAQILRADHAALICMKNAVGIGRVAKIERNVVLHCKESRGEKKRCQEPRFAHAKSIRGFGFPREIWLEGGRVFDEKNSSLNKKEFYNFLLFSAE